MVDAAASTKREIEDSSPKRGVSSTQPAAAVSLLDVAAYSIFAQGNYFAPAQSPAWVREWVRHSGQDCAIVQISLRHGGQIALPLEVSKVGPLKVARFMGNRHANGNFPPSSGSPGRIEASEIVAAVKQVRPDVDLLLLERMAQQVSGAVNPLAHLPQQQSPNVSLAADLDGGFDALLDRASGKRKRKKHRSQTRKFEAVGPIRRITPATANEVNHILDAFFELKAARFREMGLTDVFADEGTRSFFRGLFTSSLMQEPKQFALQALEVDGKLRAITGCSRSADRMICEFGAIASDDLAHASPGEFLFFDNIREACDEGFAVFDFSVGDEYYKRLWCNIEEHQFDVRLATSLNGRVLAGLLGAAASAKRSIKANPLVWSTIKRFRRSKALSSAETADQDRGIAD